MADHLSSEKSHDTATTILANQDIEKTGQQAEPISESPNARPACFKSTVQEVLFVFSATMAIAMSAILAGSITVTSSFIADSLHMTTAQLTWLNSASSLSGGAFLLFFGMVADLFGRKLIFVTSMFLFSVFCLVAGFSKSAIALDVVIGVLGLMSAAAVPPAVGILGVIYHQPGRRKNAAFASFAAGNPLGFVCGTIFGGIAASLFGWRASFFLNSIIFLFSAVVAMICVPGDIGVKEPLTWAALGRFDYVGTILTICGIGMFTAALSLGEDAPDGWKTGYVLALLIVGFCLMVFFVFWEGRVEKPLMPMQIWRDRNFTLVLCILMLGVMSFTPSTFFIALFFQNVWHRSALGVAIFLLPMAINGVIVNIFAGRFLHKISSKTLMLVGASAYAVANLLFALNTAHSSYWAFCFPGFIIMVVGADLQFNVANMYVMSSMPPAQQSLAGGVFQTVTKLCMAVGFGIATVVFDSVGKNPRLSHYWDEATQPYAAVFWVSFACSSASIFLVPYLTIGTQGGDVQSESLRSVSLAVSTEEEKDGSVIAVKI